MKPDELAKMYMNENHIAHAIHLTENGRRSDVRMYKGMQATLIQDLEPSEKFVIESSARPLTSSTVHHAITTYFTTRGYHPITGKWGWNVRTYAQDDPSENVSVIASQIVVPNKDTKDLEKKMAVVVIPNSARFITNLNESQLDNPSASQSTDIK
jgi:hypothetical protein